MKTNFLYIILFNFISVSFFCLHFFSCKPKGNEISMHKKEIVSSDIPNSAAGDSIRYGKELIVNTALYLGPKGRLGNFSNGMNCQNCHLEAGTVLFANPFFAIAHTYPKYRERSGRVESVEFRVNECMERSLNGKKIDSASKEMQSIVAYLKWISKDTLRHDQLQGMGTMQLPYLNRPADPGKGSVIYNAKCALCHGPNGEGRLAITNDKYIYPPLWGSQSFNVSAGIYRISKLAGFIKTNMPYGSKYNKSILNNEEAWDVAAFIVSKKRTEKKFARDYANLEKKPVDYPFGPYTDTFTEKQHKYGPFMAIEKYHRENLHYGTLVKYKNPYPTKQ